MHFLVLHEGKREQQRVEATYSLPRQSRRLFVKDKSSNVTFLIDTGSDVSIIPASASQKKHNPTQTLCAANSSPIHVYGQKLLCLDLNLRRPFKWSFLVGTVSTPIIGADLLYYYDLSPNLRNKCLVDLSTKLKTNCTLRVASVHSVKSVAGDTVYHNLLREYPDITKPPSPNQEVKHNVVHYIETTGPPTCAKPRRLAPDRLKIAKAEFQHMIDLGHMQPSKSNYASPLHMVQKKDCSDWRPVGDFRALNAQTVKDKYGVPNILDFASELYGNNIFSHVDLVKAYHQIPIHPDHVHKTAITTPFGLFESTRMQFGLCNAASTFQRFVDEVFRGLPFVYAFVDDILIASPTPEEHLEHLRLVFERLKTYGLSLKPSKCVLGVPTLDFLGFKVSATGIEPLADRVQTIQNFPEPTTITQLRRFLGLFNYYRRFVRQAAHILAPLVKFLEGVKNKKKSRRQVKPKPEDILHWTDEAREAFKLAKESLANATLLYHPKPGAQLSIWVDASNVAVGGALMQFDNNQWLPLAFLSMKLTTSQRNWSTYDRELLAIYTCVRRFRHMLEGRDFVIYTDQKPLIYAFRQKLDKCSPRQLRQLDFISQFSTDIRHVKGTDNIVADALSRIEIDSISHPPALDYQEFARAQLHDEELQEILNSESCLKLEKQYFPLEDVHLFCDISTEQPRPFVPVSLRNTVFQHLHHLSHPGIAATTHLISKRFVWPGMRKFIKDSVRSCNKCQRSKVFRHTKAPFHTFALPDARFAHLHIDFIGPLPPSEGNQYCLTIIDRFTRWPEVIPTPDMTAETTCRALLNGWIARFGTPVTITSDQGRNFESSLFRELTNTLGTNRIHSSSYHPQSNGLIERFHRHLKSAIKAHEHTKWTEILPIVLLGLRTALKCDINASSAELVYGTSLRLPADLLSTEICKHPVTPTYVSELCARMRKLNPVATSVHGNSNFYVNPTLKSCTHVFLRVDKLRPALTPPYSGPHLVIERNDKNFTIEINGQRSTVSIDRVKPAFQLSDTLQPPKLVDIPQTQCMDDTAKTVVTRSGRRVRFVKRLVEEV